MLEVKKFWIQQIMKPPFAIKEASKHAKKEKRRLFIIFFILFKDKFIFPLLFFPT